ncbi:hypothetical protein A2154_02680 [Candidatus Gottesmanbacteria bacterium RBG_16_43_7]|uniref:Uncharacterized protein n=1 Tax=Candidatus Gottesmanbacteria bacterium RBG_16_43_7 TaxID=1798373 RepID=A0A1F5Z996_9BACT|nr:MAG: hypothetical protein A2154_02680 [Candidatus Gottesmanbacteria bacterium RBG_16_43_7]
MLTKGDFDQIGKIIDSKLEQKLKPVHQKIDKMNRKLDTTIKYFDTVTTKHHKRLKRVEDHLNLPPTPDYS